MLCSSLKITLSLPVMTNHNIYEHDSDICLVYIFEKGRQTGTMLKVY